MIPCQSNLLQEHGVKPATTWYDYSATEDVNYFNPGRGHLVVWRIIISLRFIIVLIQRNSLRLQFAN